ncbi:MAG: hypothetical protein JWQ08_2202, partial [Deinococcus sp.]|nr:hypothetical protein [Deinococcus sp.]
KSSFSQYGALSVLAPGEGMAAPAPQNRIAAWIGTSMATHVAAGAAALALSLSVGPEAAVARLKASAGNVDALSGNVLYQGKLGAGQLDLAALTQRP